MAKGNIDGTESRTNNRRKDERKRRQNTSKKVKAYFTVEAAMVVPIVLGMIMLLLYLAFFQYNRCLLEQDMTALSIKSCSEQAEEKEDLLVRLEQAEEEINRDKYIAWDMENADIKIYGNSICISGGGEMQFPFLFLLPGDVRDVWTAKATYEAERIDAVKVIRLYEKIKGGK